MNCLCYSSWQRWKKQLLLCRMSLKGKTLKDGLICLHARVSKNIFHYIGVWLSWMSLEGLLLPLMDLQLHGAAVSISYHSKRNHFSDFPITYLWSVAKVEKHINLLETAIILSMLSWALLSFTPYKWILNICYMFVRFHSIIHDICNCMLTLGAAFPSMCRIIERKLTAKLWSVHLHVIHNTGLKLEMLWSLLSCGRKIRQKLLDSHKICQIVNYCCSASSSKVPQTDKLYFQGLIYLP